MSEVTGRLSTALADCYRIERELGAGGMATVFLAEDLKHKRRVAVKVLKPELAAVLGAERFIQEITTTAALQHPHILPLFDSGTADGFLYYVMPFIDGETLRGKLDRETQFGIDEAVKIASQVADALDYAHRHGVIHRDIKPENILLHDGRPMVADFGIALAVSAAAGGRMTETGLSLGTPHYMSPEQATAEKEITGRSDIYSLASVLYEMLAGNPPHVGASAQQIIMKIIAEPVEAVTKFRKSVPPNVAAAVAKALEKLPADRFASAKDFADALQNTGYTDASIARTAGRAADGATRVTTPAFLAASLVAVVAVAGWTWSALRPAPPVMHVRFTLVVSDSARIRPEVSNQNFTISPDGSQIVFMGGAATAHLHMRGLNDLEARSIPGTNDARNAKFSPDGKWLAFTQGPALMKIPLLGGPAVTIADSGGVFSWGENDVIVYARGGTVWRVSASGGTPTTLVKVDTSHGGTSFSWPFLLPGGKALVFDAVTANEQGSGQLAAARLDDGKVIPLGLTGRNPRYVASGHLLFGRLDGTVVAVPFDAEHLRVTGPAVTVLDNVYIKGGGASEFAVSGDGTLLMVAGNAASELLVADRAGAARPLIPGWRTYAHARFSPTGGRVVFQTFDRASFARKDIWVYNDRTATVTRLTNDGRSTDPFWTGDGERIVWMTRDSLGKALVRRQRWDGSGTVESLFDSVPGITFAVPSPVGNGYAVVKNGRFADLYFADGDRPTTLRPLVVTPSAESGPSFSPDGKWVAYFGDETGQREIYVIAASGDGGRHLISTDGGSEPVWGGDGKTLYYRAGGKIIAAGIATTPAFTVTRREALFDDRFRRSDANGLANYDVSRDGKSFLMIGGGEQSSARMVVITGWLDELKERMALAAKK